MDCFAVAFAASFAKHQWHPSRTFLLALSFGIFQGGMPVIGWLAGHSFRDELAVYDHWIAFVLLSLIGGKLVYESIHGEPEESIAAQLMSFSGILFLSLATSIDALAAGLSFSVMATGLLLPVLSIGIVAALMTILGSYLGRWVLGRLDRWAALAGGLVLIGIGLRIVIEHSLSGI